MRSQGGSGWSGPEWRCAPLADYRTADVPDAGVRLVLGYAHLAPSDIVRGVRLMAHAVRAAR
ncbi:hypothetical protein HRW23_06515 [Streptomyces lunaelactis]|uniref:hypothetical protein n=1 Tax=Streptomyces lunaelactis TaxID=1535768 RepID=UPI001585B9CE|nr:hypothetical protein [Streptomyces lunaelactis]NUK69933.1 hypothetical protein [Streptomyces lunaelactis]NUK77061.1 hypothetical protein [Streptomyces lunaelactis]